jgi:hypothetical protein
VRSLVHLIMVTARLALHPRDRPLLLTYKGSALRGGLSHACRSVGSFFRSSTPEHFDDAGSWPYHCPFETPGVGDEVPDGMITAPHHTLWLLRALSMTITCATPWHSSSLPESRAELRCLLIFIARGNENIVSQTSGRWRKTLTSCAMCWSGGTDDGIPTGGRRR